MTALSIRKVRLVNFHNFVDETIELPRGGHLFLLGDNGSGKTTVLDAIHYALSGGEDLELNAAARVGGRREDGRTIQGIVLRFDPERGVQREGGAVAYAAVEAASEDGRRVLTFGVGTEATTLEARVQRWGFIAARPLAEIPLVDGARVVANRDELRATLGAAALFGHMSGYQRELGRRLFGNEAEYAAACRFWQMAKAYREIVAGARDFAGLFERLLPEPDREVFGAILRGLREIDELEVKLEELAGQRDYVDGLLGVASQIGEARAAAARYRWLIAQRDRDEAEVQRTARAGEAAELRERATLAASDVDVTRARVERADRALARAESDDLGSVASSLREASRRREELAAELERVRRRSDEQARRTRDAERELNLRRVTLAEAYGAVADELVASATDVAELPGAGAALIALADEIRAGEHGPVQARRIAEAERELDRRVLDERVTLANATAARDAAEARQRELASEPEVAPAVDGWRTVRAALAADGVTARPIYELLEPHPDAPPSLLAAVEALAGDALLGAFLCGGDVDSCRRRCAGLAPDVRVVVAEAPDAILPSWIEGLFVPPCDATTVAARRALAAGLCQPPSLGEVGPPAETSALSIRGTAFRARHDRPILLGAEARRAEQARRCQEAAGAVTASRSRITAAEHALRRSERVLAALAALRGPDLLLARSAVDSAASAVIHYAPLGEALASEREAIEARDAVAAAEIAALRSRADGADLAHVEAQIEALRRARELARTDLDRAQEHRIRLVARAEASEQESARLAAVIAAHAEELVRATRTLRSHLEPALATGGDDAIAHHVRVTMRGDSFRTTEGVRQRLAETERAAELATHELEGDGSTGVYCLRFATQFGFRYERASNRIEDRRGQAAAGVAAELARTIAEQREVVGERTRALMDQLVLGELVRHLQRHVDGLQSTIVAINRRLEQLRFGATRYRFHVAPRSDRKALVELVRRVSVLDEASRTEFRGWVDERLDELRASDERQIPELLDYRRWYEFKLKMDTVGGDGVELTRELRQLGSGGEQGVPNYLLALALAGLLYDAAGATVRPLFFDEAFYGIDAGRRDRLLEFATALGLQLFVASPDQDGVTPAVRSATTLLVVKDEHHDVHLAPYHYWNREREAQSGLFDPPTASPADAICAT